MSANDAELLQTLFVAENAPLRDQHLYLAITNMP